MGRGFKSQNGIELWVFSFEYRTIGDPLGMNPKPLNGSLNLPLLESKFTPILYKVLFLHEKGKDGNHKESRNKGLGGGGFNLTRGENLPYHAFR
jgi:hypothetical protein